MSLKNRMLSTVAAQSGFLIPLALIMLVGISFLAIAINRMSGQSGTHAIIEGISTQAFYAAESGAQYGMSRLYGSAGTRALVDANCVAMASVTINYAVPGLASCTAIVTCRRAIDSSDIRSFYYINSVAQCGGGQLMGEREIEIAAFMQ